MEQRIPVKIGLLLEIKNDCRIRLEICLQRNLKRSQKNERIVFLIQRKERNKLWRPVGLSLSIRVFILSKTETVVSVDYYFSRRAKIQYCVVYYRRGTEIILSSWLKRMDEWMRLFTWCLPIGAKTILNFTSTVLRCYTDGVIFIVNYKHIYRVYDKT